MKKASLLFLVLCMLLAAFQNTQAQVIPYKPRKSQIALATLKTPNAYIKINYGQPLKNERTIFGGSVVPYGKIWRTGANESTEITTTADLRFGNKVLKAGTYSIFTIPRADKWTIIFNSDLGAWGDYEYDEKKDVLRVEAPASTMPETYEAFTIKLKEGKPNPEMQFMWDRTLVVLPFEIASSLP